MSSSSRTISRAELVIVLRRTGYSEDLIAEITAQLDDPIDADRDRQILERYGLTGERLMGRLGASP